MALDAGVIKSHSTMTTENNNPSDAPAVVRTFRDMPEAFAARAALEGAGIECYLQDETVVRLDWLWSNLLGGLKLVVKKSNADEARKILDERSPAKFDVEGVGEYEQPHCPSCGSLDVSCDEFKKNILAAGLFLGFPIPIVEKGWHCHSCEHRWRGNEEDGLVGKK